MCNRKAVHAKIEEIYTTATRIWGHTFRRPDVRFDLRGRVAGTAQCHTRKLNFNMTLLNENVDAFLTRTVVHEVAHLIDHVINAGKNTTKLRGQRSSPHGRDWQKIMVLLGANPSRCHTYDTSNSKQRRTPAKNHSYKCGGCQGVFPMGATRHKRMQAGTTTYSHCSGHKLKLV